MRKLPDEIIELAEQDGKDWYGNKFRNYPEDHQEIMEGCKDKVLAGIRDVASRQDKRCRGQA